MARLSEPCAECRALVPADLMAAHLAWHAGLSTAIANLQTATAGHPHGPVTPP